MGDDVAHGCLDRHARGVIAERAQPAALRLGDIWIVACGRIASGLATDAMTGALPHAAPSASIRSRKRRPVPVPILNTPLSLACRHLQSLAAARSPSATSA